MRNTLIDRPPISDRSGVTDAVRAQILATEHWSLLATRNMTWNEIFSRASMFMTVVSAATVALALMAQGTGFNEHFSLFALLVLPVVLFIGLATYVRLADANEEDQRLVMGMNRLRHAYLELAPELEPYFVTGHHDDLAGVVQTYGFEGSPQPRHVVGSTPAFVGVINSVVAGVIAALIVEALDRSVALSVAVGVIAGIAMLALLLGVVPYREITRAQRTAVPAFPTEESEASPPTFGS